MAASHWTREDREKSKDIFKPYKDILGTIDPPQKNPSGLKFDVGNRVGIISKPHLGAGFIDWIGRVEGFEEEWVGIRLDLPRGKTDGKIKGVQNFTCDPKHGIYAPISDIDHPDKIKNLAHSEPPPERKPKTHCFFCLIS